ncbi:MAG: TlpA family protein disulfide reductase [Cyclobacteriaceae bacterium]|nr:TlpA family protein disulfide reductase [Cyclobacteriaceae bacterium]
MIILKKIIKEWGLIIALFGVLYFTGLHTEVAAFTQRIVLATGLFTPGDDLIMESEAEDFDYNVTIQTPDGTDMHLSELKGKLIFLNLWATWCAPCRAEMPGIQELYDELDHDNIAFVMLSIDRNPKAALQYIEGKDFTYPLYLANGPLNAQLSVPSIPTTFVISPSGKIIKKNVGMAKYNTKSFKNFLMQNAGK